MKMRVTLLVMVLLDSAVGGLSQATEIKPPTIRYGEDKCADCDMIINDERFAATAIREIHAGDYESLLFDDIGDMVRYMKEHSDQKFAAVYVHDYDTKAWIEAEKAVYVDSNTSRRQWQPDWPPAEPGWSRGPSSMERQGDGLGSSGGPGGHHPRRHGRNGRQQSADAHQVGRLMQQTRSRSCLPCHLVVRTLRSVSQVFAGLTKSALCSML